MVRHTVYSRRFGRLLLGVLACVLASVTGILSCSSELRPYVDKYYRAVGICRSAVTREPLAGVIVSYLETYADSSGFHLRTTLGDTTDVSGHYAILLAPWLHGSLGFQRAAYRPTTRELSAVHCATSSKDDYEIQVDVDLQPEVGIPTSSSADGM